MELLAGRYGLTCLEKHQRYQGVYRGIGIEVSESDEVITLVFDSPSADLGEEAAKGFPTFRHCAQARVPSEWFASSQERSRNRCLMHVTQRRLNLIGLAGFLEIPGLVARDFHEHGATESAPPEPREGEAPGGDASLAGEPAQQARPRQVEFGKPELQWYHWFLLRRLIWLAGVGLIAAVSLVVTCRQRTLPERPTPPPERESYNRGVAALNRGDCAAAIAEFTEAIRFDPRDAEAYVGWGAALARLGRPAEGCEKYAKAVEINPRYALAYYYWGLALVLLGPRAEAEEKLNKAAELDPALKPQIEEMRRKLLGKE